MLFLLTEAELNILNSEIISEVQVGINHESLENLLLTDSPEIIITTGYVEYIGIERCISLLKSSLIFKSFTFYYLMNDKKLDTFAAFLINHTKQPTLFNLAIKYLTYERYKKIVSGAYVNEYHSGDIYDFRNDYLQLNKIIADINTIQDVAIQNTYIKDKSSQLLEILPVIKNIIEENKDIKVVYDSTTMTNELLATSLEKLNTKYKESQGQIQYLTESLNKATSYITHHQHIISSYNEIINKSHKSLHTTFSTESNTLIFYFKELDDIKFYNIYKHLIYIFSHVFKVYVKSLIIENPGKDYLSSYIHDSVYEYNQNSTYRDAINHDNLICYGNARYLLEFLTKEELKLDVLFIFDRLHTLAPVIESPKCCTFIVGNSITDYLGVTIPDEVFISPYEGLYCEELQVLKPIRRGQVDDFNARLYIQRTTFLQYLMQIATPYLLTDKPKAIEIEGSMKEQQENNAVSLIKSVLNEEV